MRAAGANQRCLGILIAVEMAQDSGQDQVILGRRIAPNGPFLINQRGGGAMPGRLRMPASGFDAQPLQLGRRADPT